MLVSLPLKYNQTKVGPLCCLFTVHFLRGKKEVIFSLFMMIIIFNFLSVHVPLQCMCTCVCAYVYVCIWRTEINVKYLFSVTLRAHCRCLEPNLGEHSRSHGRLFTVEPSPQRPHFLFSTHGRYLGSVFVSVLIITSRFEVQENSRIVELAVDFRVTPSWSYCASEYRLL